MNAFQGSAEEIDGTASVLPDGEAIVRLARIGAVVGKAATELAYFAKLPSRSVSRPVAEANPNEFICRPQHFYRQHRKGSGQPNPASLEQPAI